MPALLFLLICLGRVLVVSLYAESCPYWDQWDAEGDRLLRPWLEGTLSWQDLIAPHNEHRLLFTRLVELAVFEASDRQWDNLVAAYVNIFLYAAIMSWLFALLAPGLRDRATRAIFFAALLVLSWLPYGQDNTLFGFANQYYLLNCGAIAAVVLASVARDRVLSIVGLALLCTLNLFTMASGLLAAATAIAILALRVWFGEWRKVRGAIALALLLGIIGLGFKLKPVVFADWQAHTFDVFVTALGVTTGWPLRWGFIGAALLWYPAVFALVRLLRERRHGDGELIALGLAGWTLLQCLAIAFARGTGLADVSSRYTDTLALGLVANAWLALAQWHRGLVATSDHRALKLASVAAMLLAAALGFALRLPGQVKELAGFQGVRAIQTDRVRAFMATFDPAHLSAPYLHIPYPDSGRLRALLQTKVLQDILPASIRKPLEAGVEAPWALHALPEDERGKGTWQSPPLTSSHSFIQVQVEGRGERAPGTKNSGLKIGVLAAEDSTWKPVSLLMPAVRYFRVGDAPFRVAAKDESAYGSMSFSPPREASRLSMLAGSLQNYVRRLASR